MKLPLFDADGQISVVTVDIPVGAWHLSGSRGFEGDDDSVHWPHGFTGIPGAHEYWSSKVCRFGAEVRDLLRILHMQGIIPRMPNVLLEPSSVPQAMDGTLSVLDLDGTHLGEIPVDFRQSPTSGLLRKLADLLLWWPTDGSWFNISDRLDGAKAFDPVTVWYLNQTVQDLGPGAGLRGRSSWGDKSILVEVAVAIGSIVSVVARYQAPSLPNAVKEASEGVRRIVSERKLRVLVDPDGE